MPFTLSYNSQLWFQEGAGQTKLGAGVDYDFGWKLLAGALTPIWDSYNLVCYLFTDSSGAEYRLDVNENGVRRSSQGVYVYNDGSPWIRPISWALNSRPCTSITPVTIQTVHIESVPRDAIPPGTDLLVSAPFLSTRMSRQLCADV